MIIRPVQADDRDRYDKVAGHPLQSWAWGDFRQATGLQIGRLGTFDEQGVMTGVLQATFSPIPVLGGTAGYIPRGPQPVSEHFPALRALAQQHNAIFIKLEPDVMYPLQENMAQEPFGDVRTLLAKEGAVPGRTLFAPNTFVIDLTPDEEVLSENCKSKTRYNIRLAKKNGVTVVEDTTQAGLEEYLKLLAETTDRQGFYAHDEAYFRKMWEIIEPTGMIRLLKAVWQGKTLAAWILFIWNGVAYYPYGASTRENREVMASSLLMWEAILFAKANGCRSFDLWGSLGLNPNPKDQWYGFHRFKEGFGAQLMQAIGTYDLVVNDPIYKVVTVANDWRWRWLRFKARLGK